MKQMISVRLKSVPLTRSKREGAPPSLASISTVRSNIANVSWSLWADLLPRRWMERRASFLRPRRMSHHGDSGAKNISIRSGVYRRQLCFADTSSRLTNLQERSTVAQEAFARPIHRFDYWCRRWRRPQ
jgi:hypothetical protein